ncbi:flagella accessory protein C [Halolamina pelagica]|nr:flagella accessory protein C [Halolamina pelagica]
MFGSNDPDTPEEPDEEIDQTAPADAGAPPIDSDELDSEREVPSDDADEGPDVNELDVRIDELQDDLDSTDASLQQLRNSQEEMADSIDEMNDRVRQLVGVYDRIAAEENPFVDDPAEATPSNGDSPMAAVEGSQRGEAAVNGAHGADEAPEQQMADGTDDDVVSFDDLWEEQDEPAGQNPPATGEPDGEDLPPKTTSRPPKSPSSLPSMTARRRRRQQRATTCCSRRFPTATLGRCS